MRYLEDFTVGQRFMGGPVEVTEDMILRYAREFDPQPFHLDHAAGAKSFFGALAASGWHTASLTMRMVVDSGIDPAGGTIGFAMEELRWPRAVRPGDRLRLEAEVLDARRSASQPGRGILKMRYRTLNQRDEDVMVFVVAQIVQSRPTGVGQGEPDGGSGAAR